MDLESMDRIREVNNFAHEIARLLQKECKDEPISLCMQRRMTHWRHRIILEIETRGLVYSMDT